MTTSISLDSIITIATLKYSSGVQLKKKLKKEGNSIMGASNFCYAHFGIT